MPQNTEQLHHQIPNYEQHVALGADATTRTSLVRGVQQQDLVRHVGQIVGEDMFQLEQEVPGEKMITPRSFLIMSCVVFFQ